MNSFLVSDDGNQYYIYIYIKKNYRNLDNKYNDS